MLWLQPTIAVWKTSKPILSLRFSKSYWAFPCRINIVDCLQTIGVKLMDLPDAPESKVLTLIEVRWDRLSRHDLSTTHCVRRVLTKNPKKFDLFTPAFDSFLQMQANFTYSSPANIPSWFPFIFHLNSKQLQSLKVIWINRIWILFTE